MSLPKPDIHVRLLPDADAALELIAAVEQRTKVAVAEQLLTERLLGRGYAVRVAALRFARLGLSGSGREAA